MSVKPMYLFWALPCFCCCSEHRYGITNTCLCKKFEHFLISTLYNTYMINVHLQSGRKCSDYDDDCKDGLVCWYDDGSGEVPGCSGTPEPTWEYCINPTTMPLQNATQSGAQIVAADSIEADSDARPSLSERGGLNRCEGDW